MSSPAPSADRSEEDDGSRPLPAECELELLLRLPTLADVARCRLVCKRWKALVDSPTFWRRRAIRDYRLTEQQMAPWRVMEPVDFYKYILCRFGPAVGLWRRTDAHCYGGLYKVEFNNLGLCCYEMMPPPCTDYLRHEGACDQLRAMGVKLPSSDAPLELRRRMVWQLAVECPPWSSPDDVCWNAYLYCHCNWRCGEIAGAAELEDDCDYGWWPEEDHELDEPYYCVFPQRECADWLKTAYVPGGLRLDYIGGTMESNCYCAESATATDYLWRRYGLCYGDTVSAEHVEAALAAIGDEHFATGLQANRRRHRCLSWKLTSSVALNMQLDEPERISLGRNMVVETSDFLPAPGVYACDYGEHGYELLYAHHVADYMGSIPAFVVDKLTGNTKVAGGQRSVLVPLGNYCHTGYATFDMAGPWYCSHKHVTELCDCDSVGSRRWQSTKFRVGDYFDCAERRRIDGVHSCWFQFGAKLFSSPSAIVPPTSWNAVFAALDRRSFVVRWLKPKTVFVYYKLDV